MSNDIRNPGIRNYETPPSDLEPSSDYDFDDGYDSDFGMEPEGDYGFGGDEYTGGGEEPPVWDVNGLRGYLADLLNGGEITQSQYHEFMGRVNSCLAMSGPDREQALSNIGSDINNLISPPPAEGEGTSGLDDPFADDPLMQELGNEGQPGENSLVTEIDEFIASIQADENLDPTIKQDLIEQANTLKGKAVVLEEGSDALYNLEEEFSTIQETYTQYQTAPAGITEFAQQLGVDVQTLMEAAAAHNIDLNKYINPTDGSSPPNPDDEFMNFLLDLKPELKGKIDEIKAQMNERKAKIEENTTEAETISNKNQNDGTTKGDDHNIAPHQFLYDAKYHQTSYDKRITELNEDVRGDLIDMLKVFYPDERIKKVKPEDLSGSFEIPESEGEGEASAPDPFAGGLLGGGMMSSLFPDLPGASPADNSWMNAANDYLVSDKIKFGDLTLDFINADSGDIQANTSYEKEPEVQLVTVMYDNEGDGQWYPSDLVTYNDSNTPVGYDPDAG